MNLPRYVLYGCGQLGMMALARFFFVWVLKFAEDGGRVPGSDTQPESVALFSAAIVGLVFLGFRLFDGVTDPIAGMVSDGWVKRGRERRSLLWLSFALPPIGMALVFAPNASMEPWLRWTLLASGMFLFFVGYTFYAIPYWSLIDDYGRKDAERRVMSNILGAGLLLATILGFVVGLAIKPYGYFLSALSFSVPALILMVLPWFAQPPGGPARRDSVEASTDDPGLLFGLKTALTHRRFLAVLVIFSGSQMSFTVMSAAAPFLASRLLGGSEDDVFKIMAPFLGTALLTFVAVPALSRRLGWQRGVVAASIALGVVYTGTAGLGLGLVGSPMTTAMALFALGGPMAAALLGLEGEAITACARERGGEVTSVYWGVFNFIVKSLNGVALFLTGLLADASRGDMGAGAVRGMGILAGGLLALGCLGYFLIRPRTPVQPAKG